MKRQMTSTQDKEIITLALKLKLEELEQKLEWLKKEDYEVHTLYRDLGDNTLNTILDLVVQGLNNEGQKLYDHQLVLHNQLCDMVYKFLQNKMATGHFFQQFKYSWSCLLSVPYMYYYEGGWQGDGSYSEIRYIGKEAECNALKTIRARYLMEHQLDILLKPSLITKFPQRFIEEAVYLKAFVFDALLKVADKLPSKQKIDFLQESISLESNGFPSNCLAKILHTHNGNCIQQVGSFFWHKNLNTATVNKIQKQIQSIQNDCTREQERATEETNLLELQIVLK